MWAFLQEGEGRVERELLGKDFCVRRRKGRDVLMLKGDAWGEKRR